MAHEELSDDPHAFAFVKAHHRVVPGLRRRRRRVLVLRFVGSLALVAAVSVIAATSLRATPGPSAQFVADADGGGVLTVEPTDGFQVADDIAAQLSDDIRRRIRVEPTNARPEVEGRVHPDVVGLLWANHDPLLDNTATEVHLAPDAEGTIYVMVPTPADERPAVTGADLRCQLVGLPYPVAAERVRAAGLFPRPIVTATSPEDPDLAFVREAVSLPNEAVFELAHTRDETLEMVRWCEEAGFPAPTW